MMKRYWEFQMALPGGKPVHRRVSATSVTIGSSPEADLKLPATYPAFACLLREEAGEYIFMELSGECEHWDGKSWSSDEHATLSRAPKVRVKGLEIQIRDVTKERLDSRASPENWMEKNEKTDGSHDVLWHMHDGQLVESVPLFEEKTALRCGYVFERVKGANTATLRDALGKAHTLQFTPAKGKSLRAEFGQDVFVLTPAPDVKAAESIQLKVEKTQDPLLKRGVIGVLATYLLFMGMIQLIKPAPIEEADIEKLPDNIAKLILEAPKDSGGGDGKEGGGGVETAAQDKRGGSGMEAQRMNESSGLEEAVATKGALGAIAKAEKVLGSGVMKALEVGGQMANALSALDEGVKSGKVKVASLGGGSANGKGAASGVLGAIGAVAGSGGKGANGVGVGGVGTKGIGGGGGGGNGTGFGTGTGAGLGKGDGARGLSFGDGEGSIMGGLERAEVEAVIQENISQIRYCYNKGLRENPSLQGKVISAFIISGDGSVKTSGIKNSTLREPSVEGCIRERVASWKFPQPRGGGEVQVNYPFLLKSN